MADRIDEARRFQRIEDYAGHHKPRLSFTCPRNGCDSEFYLTDRGKTVAEQFAGVVTCECPDCGKMFEVTGELNLRVRDYTGGE